MFRAPGSSSSVIPNFPSAQRQFVFASTGALAGAATLPIEILWSKAQAGQALGLRSHLPPASTSITTIYRAAVRFWIFDIVRSQLNQRLPESRESPSARSALIGGLSGASGGFAEVLFASLTNRRPTLPSLFALANQSSKLLFCFGSYTYISTSQSSTYGIPPKPFPVAWIMGATAGAFGSTLLAAVEGVRKTPLAIAGLRGALIVGTVISVQVSSSAGILKRLGV